MDVALHIGDYDRHGRDIFRAMSEDVASWVPYYSTGQTGPWQYSWATPEQLVLLRAGSRRLTVVRLAVTKAQVDSGVVELDAEGKAEAEALPADWQILRDEFDRLLDSVRRNLVVEREPEFRAATIRLLLSRLLGGGELV